MGVNDREDEKKYARKARDKEKRKWGGAQKPGSQTADWASVDREKLLAAICAVANMGGALRLGYTRDLGAYSIGIYGDGTPFSETRGPSEDLEYLLEQIAETYGK